MRLVTRGTPAAIALAMSAGLLAGCGGSGVPTMAPISVSLNPRTVVVAQNGTPTSVQILIVSTSETALVSVVGLPGGLQATYAATDTNPSGLLTFKAVAHVTAGTYMPGISVNSAGQTATLTFTLIVPAA